MRATALILSLLFCTSVLAIGISGVVRALPYQWPEQVSVRAGEAARRFEAHYDEVFPFRTLGTNVWAAIQYRVFEEGRAGVVVGDGGWLYTQEEFRGWPRAVERIEQRLDTIADIDRQLARRGSALIVALVPAKARVYPEHRNGSRPAALHHDLYANLRRGLLDRGVTTPDLFRTLAQCKLREPVFLRTDTHWTPAGAHCAAREIAATAERLGRSTGQPQHYGMEPQAPREHRGDLLAFLPLTPYFASLLPEPDIVAAVHTVAAAQPDLFADLPAPQVWLIGTSYSADPLWNFSGALQAELHEDVLNLAESGRGPFAPMQDHLASPPPGAIPRLVIWEIPERYLPAQIDEAASAKTQAQPDPSVPEESPA